MAWLLIITVHLFLMYREFETIRWTLFRRAESLDGKICQDADLAFTKRVYDKSICLFECVNHVNCECIFYVQHTGHCTGCTVSYGITTPTGLAAGSVYYGLANCPGGWFNIGNSQYCILDAIMNFETGASNCETMNAHVVTFENMDESNNIKSLITSLTFSGKYWWASMGPLTRGFQYLKLVVFDLTYSTRM